MSWSLHCSSSAAWTAPGYTTIRSMSLGLVLIWVPVGASQSEGLDDCVDAGVGSAGVSAAQAASIVDNTITVAMAPKASDEAIGRDVAVFRKCVMAFSCLSD